jgi:adenylyl-sulfate kinase
MQRRMQHARPAIAPAKRALRVDVGGGAGVARSDLIVELQSAEPVFGLKLRAADFSDPADVAIVLTTALDGFSREGRQAVAIARTSGVRHVVLAVHMPDGAAPAAFDALRASFADFASRFEFTSAVAIPLGGGEHARLLAHLAALAAAIAAPEPQPSSDPPQLTEQFAAHVACVSQAALLPGREYALKLAGQQQTASVTAVKYRLDVDTLRRVPARTLARGEIGVCTIATHAPLAVAAGTDSDRFTLSDLYSGAMIAAGTVDFALRRGMNLHWQPLTVSKELRASLKDQRACIVWFTGLSGAGKSTIANLVEGWLALHGRHTYLLDGDNVRHGLNKDLGFTAADRVENIRRVGEVARLFVDAGTIVLCSFISPFRAERAAVRSLVDAGEFIEIHVTAPLEVCERRDPKGLYARSRAGQLPNFTGIDSPYEAPEDPDLVLDTTTAPAAELAQRVVALLQARGIVTTTDGDIRAAGGL